MNDPKLKILVVDDEPAIRKLLRVGLTTEGYTVVEAANGSEADERIAMDRPDIVVLDLGLPDTDGHTLLQRWRENGISLPILILSSRTDEAGIVRALEEGADDYIPKPFGMKELAARLRVALRHRLQQQGQKPLFQCDGLTVDLVRRIVKLNGEEIKLSPKEYDILSLLVQHAGKVLTHHFILSQVWGPAADVQYLRIYVRQLRQKIEKSPDQPHYILTETGVGYRLREADPAL
ncbi:response regulator transcription factor [Brucella intermedia]|uniref:response regulator transcription factor n=1 Tax=Brucella intermedia TaxID=94625 RepID=UPI00224AAF7E|nr:response regulator transcription factor [Brucella intermedia]